MSSTFFNTVMESERLALVTEQRLAGAPSFSAVRDIAEVRDRPTILRGKHPVNLEALGDGSFVQVCPTLGYRFLWAHVDNDDYRRSYAAHLARSHGAAAPTALPSDLHVDHLYNRERARVFNLSYIRMVLLPRGINTSHGAGYEKKRTHGVGRGGGRSRSVDTITLMKLFGFRSPPTNGKATPEIAAFAALLGPLLGEDPDALRREVVDLLDVARFRPE